LLSRCAGADKLVFPAGPRYRCCGQTPTPPQ
jgi:hypothetical protein